mgnify:CR=1 FL=1|jgi:regulator of protease activity HflC (stomatin/prohibitin superfamily)
MTLPTQAEVDRRKDSFAVIKQAEADAEAQRATLKASAKAKLIAGEALTEAEADTVVI